VNPKEPSILLLAADGTGRHVGRESGALLEPAEPIGVAAFTPNGDLLAVDAKKRVRLTGARRSWRLERTIGNPDDSRTLADRVSAVAFSPDGKLLATGGGVPTREGELKLWRVADGTLARSITKPHADTVNAVAFSPDGEFLASAGSDRLVRIWRVSDGERAASLEGHSGHVLSVSWRSDGLAIASGAADRTVRVWDVATQKQAKSTGNFGGDVCAVLFVGPGESLLAACGDKSVRLGDQSLPQSGGYPFCAATDPIGRLVAVGSHDGVVRFWNVSDRKILRALSD
jgi:WD40 repeat protein